MGEKTNVGAGKTTYAEILEARTLVGAVPFASGKQSLPKELKIKLVFLRLDIDKHGKVFDDFCSDAVKVAKSKSYDADVQALQRLPELEKPIDIGELSSEEKTELKRLQGLKKLFDKQTEQLNDVFRAACERKAAETVDFRIEKLTRAEFAQIVDVVSEMETVEVVSAAGVQQLRQDVFLHLLASRYVEGG